MENTTDSNKTKQRFFNSFRQYLKELFDLHQDKKREETTIEEIKKGIEFKGPNLWILLFAILVASIGLNVNSPAVIIGAMLISPLMGPIMGIGLGAAINDFDLIKKALRNIGVAAVLSVLTSSLYFLVTPLHEAQSELLARTTPTLWDVLIAFFGGLAGIVAGSRKEKSNAIPGVAIATALMPPLCTAGYGLANGNWYYFVGALYLFFINSVFISVSTFIIVRVLKYPKKRFESRKSELRVKSYIWFFVLLTSIPSVYLAYNLVRQTIFEQNARNFIAVEFDFPETQVISQEFSLDNEKGNIQVTLYGKQIEPVDLNRVRKKLSNYGLEKSELNIRQGYHEDVTQVAELEFQKMSENLKLGIMEDLYKKNEEVIFSKDEQIKILQNELLKLQPKRYPISDIEVELRIQYPDLESLCIGDLITAKQDTICHVVVGFSKKHYKSEKLKITSWLEARSKVDSLIVIFQ